MKLTSHFTSAIKQRVRSNRQYQIPQQAQVEKLEHRLVLHGNLPHGFTDTTVVTGLKRPTAMEIAPDGRFFIAQQAGSVRVIKNNQLLSTPLLQVAVDDRNERGLVGITIDPNFSSNGYIYVYYTVPPGVNEVQSHNRLSRFTVSGDRAIPGSEFPMIDFPSLGESNHHNSGALHFGTDGKLYVAVGDAGVSANAQTLENPFGKILRLNSDGSIPDDNPFYDQTTGFNRAIWALGIRNAFTFGVDPANGRIFFNDVGDHDFEEVNRLQKGGNFGWPIFEGESNDPRYITPLYAYSHEGYVSSAVVGGTFYRPTTPTFPVEMRDDYFFGDSARGFIKRYDEATDTVTDFLIESTDTDNFVDVDTHPSGDLYYLIRGDTSSLHKISYTPGSLAPIVTADPQGVSVAAGESATFRVDVAGDEPLTIQWQRNEQNIPGANSEEYVVPTATIGLDQSRYRVVVTNSIGTATSNIALLTVSGGNRPVPTITLPILGTTYGAGDTLQFAGTATDSEDGTLPASAFAWDVEFHHHDHTHPALDVSGVSSGVIEVPRIGETNTDVFFRITLTVTDSTGLQSSVSTDVAPRLSQVSVLSSPAGLQGTIDSKPTTLPQVFDRVEGLELPIGIVSPQVLNGRVYVFESWSDGGSATHTVHTPVSDTTYLATYTDVGAAIEIELTSNGLDDAVTVRRNNNNEIEVVDSSNTILQRRSLSDTGLISIVGVADESDNFIIDFSNGSPLPLHGINLVGLRENDWKDQLTLQGASFDSLAISASNKTTGVIDLVSGSTSGQIRYSGIGQVVQSGALARASLSLSNENDRIAISSASGGLLNLTEADEFSTSYQIVAPSQSLDILAGVGNDFISAANLAKGSYVLSLNGGHGADTLTGGNGNDRIVGEDGNDQLFGGAGLDTVDGGDGNDSVLGDDGADSLLGQAGDDFVLGGGGGDLVQGGTGNDILNGGGGNDAMIGGDGEDVLNGQSGNDYLEGGLDADRLVDSSGITTILDDVAGKVRFSATGYESDRGDAAMITSPGSIDGVTLNGSEGDDLIDASGSNVTRGVYINGAGGNDVVRGSRFSDTLVGGSGNDTLAGADGNDVLRGGAGRDLLLGQGGIDILKGQGGNDFFSRGANGNVTKDKLDLLPSETQLSDDLFVDIDALLGI